MSKEANFENALAFAADLIRIPGLPGEEGDVARRVKEEMEALGLEDIRVDEAGNVIGVAPGRGDAPSALLNSHMDVVAEGDHEEWEVPPFSGEVRDGFLHGRGAMDIKGPLALQTYAAASMIGEAPGDVIVAHTVLEERGGLGMKHLLESRSVDPGVVVIGEATHGDVCTGHRGRAEVEVAISGLAGHASVPSRAHNALDLLGDVLAGIRDLAEDQPADPVLGRSSLIATMVDVLPESRNVIPDSAVVTIDWRILPGSDDEMLMNRVRDAISARIPKTPEGLTWEVRMAMERQRTYTGLVEDRNLLTPGFLMAADDPMILAAAEAVGRRDGEGPATIRPWKFATDGGWSCGVHGIPTVGFAPGEERFAHTNRERMDVDEARWGFERYPLLIAAVQKSLAV
ncbi:MAG: M20/M25/M40 family metallo-hydrolase [Gemmatimonadota bacterium]|nr:M20/M25/M40 family metallo-hydrolase [Gemmatimonadota bacterium]MDE3007228.1 M20/M25/M40 family metallo-hydrolase [Gemmatimonadota bacterium]MDE3013211.1 M20/M25/M40 family metallo-hydrolase [Gemmatimonadota bacterium]